MKVNKFTIDRAKWLQGESNSFLHRKSDDKMCCLGFFSLACGIKKKNITNLSCPESALEEGRVKSSKYPEWVFDWTVEYLSKKEKLRNSDIINDLMTINDDSTELTLKEKEAQIKSIFANQGVEVEFTGEYYPDKKVNSKTGFALKLNVYDIGVKKTFWLGNGWSFTELKSERRVFSKKSDMEYDYLQAAQEIADKNCSIIKRTVYIVKNV